MWSCDKKTNITWATLNHCAQMAIHVLGHNAFFFIWSLQRYYQQNHLKFSTELLSKQWLCFNKSNMSILTSIVKTAVLHHWQTLNHISSGNNNFFQGKVNTCITGKHFKVPFEVPSKCQNENGPISSSHHPGVPYIFTFKVKFDLEGQGQSAPKFLGILISVFCIFCPNLVALASNGVDLSLKLKASSRLFEYSFVLAETV